MAYLSTPEIRVKWLVHSIGGLVTIGAGVSVVGEAILRKGGGEPWFILGTIGLVVLNAGVSLFGQGVVFRVAYLSEPRKGR